MYAWVGLADGTRVCFDLASVEGFGFLISCLNFWMVSRLDGSLSQVGFRVLSVVLLFANACLCL